MSPRDTFRLCIRDIKILIYVSQNPNSETAKIADAFNLSYVRANQIVNKCADIGYVKKNKKDKLMLGGERFEFLITSKGMAFLKEIYADLQAILGDMQNGE